MALTYNNRDGAISFLRLISTLSIILCHIFQYMNNDLCAWFNVGVQVFFVISGYLYGLKTNIQTVNFIKKSFKKVLIPYWCWLVFAICFISLFPDWESGLNVKSIGLAFVGAGTLNGMRHLWFVPYILFCYLLVPYLHTLVDYCKEKSLAYTVVLYASIILLINILGFAFGSFFLPDRISAFVIAFFIPDVQRRISEKDNMVFAWTTVGIGVVAWIARYFVRYDCTSRFVRIAGLYDRYSMILAALAILFIIKQLYRGYCRLYGISDRLSYPIYLVHGLFIFGPFKILSFTPSLPFNLFLYFVVVLITAAALEFASGKLIKQWQK